MIAECCVLSNFKRKPGYKENGRIMARRNQLGFVYPKSGKGDGVGVQKIKLCCSFVFSGNMLTLPCAGGGILRKSCRWDNGKGIS